MAKKNSGDDLHFSKELAARGRYPIGLLFQVSTLAGCIAYLLFSMGGSVDVVTALYRSMVVFIGFTVSIGVLMVTVISVLHKVAMKEAEERIRLMHEEQVAEQQILEAQMNQEKIAREQRLNQAIPLVDGTGHHS
jgi:hypothetical protein